MKKVRKIVIMCILICLIGLIFLSKSFASKVMYIDSVNEYISFARNVEVNNGYENTIIILTTDLDFKGEVTPIVEGKFKGFFDGQGHKFKNINICKESVVSRYLNHYGLFESNCGLIRKVIIESGKIECDGTTGGICGENSGIVEQCANYVDIASEFVIGGIVGWNEGQGVVRACYNRGNITDLKPGTGGTVGFGGIVGNLYSGTILDCYNSGVIAPERDKYWIGSITSYYSKNSEYEYIDNCYTTEVSERYVRDEFVQKVFEFDGSVYAGLNSRGNYFASIGENLPVLNMNETIKTLPTLVMLKDIFERNSIFDNYESLVNERENLGPRTEENEAIPYITEETEVVNKIYKKEEIKNEIAIEDIKKEETPNLEDTLPMEKHEDYVSVKKEDILNITSANKNLKVDVDEREKSNGFDETTKIALVGGGFIAIIFVFVKVVIDNSTNNNDDDSHIP